MARGLIIVGLILFVGLLIYNYHNTGKFEIVPRQLTPDEQNLRHVEQRLKEIELEFAQMERSAHASGGVAPQVDFAESKRLKAERKTLEKRRDELLKKIDVTFL